jgi:hypothetical protein
MSDGQPVAAVKHRRTVRGPVDAASRSGGGDPLGGGAGELGGVPRLLVRGDLSGRSTPRPPDVRCVGGRCLAHRIEPGRP